MADLIKKSINVSTGGLLGKTAKPVKRKPRVVPDIDDEAVKMARKRTIVRQQGRSGRASTILSGGTSSSGSGYGG